MRCQCLTRQERVTPVSNSQTPYTPRAPVKAASEAMPLEFLLGRKKTPEEMLRQNQRALNRAMRDLEREKGRLEQQEKKVIADIKKLAKQGQMDAVKIMAKDLVRTRNYIKKFILMRANIQAISLKIQTLRSTNQMAQAIKGVTLAMKQMNKAMNLPQLQQIIGQFEKESATMDMKEEVMSDAIDEALGGTDDEEETEAVMTKVLDELGIELTGELSGIGPGTSTIGESAGKSSAKKPVASAPEGATGATGATGASGGGGGADLDDLESRLNNLKRE